MSIQKELNTNKLLWEKSISLTDLFLAVVDELQLGCSQLAGEAKERFIINPFQMHVNRRAKCFRYINNTNKKVWSLINTRNSIG